MYFGTPIQVMHPCGTDCKPVACHLPGRERSLLSEHLGCLAAIFAADLSVQWCQQCRVAAGLHCCSYPPARALLTLALVMESSTRSDFIVTLASPEAAGGAWSWGGGECSCLPVPIQREQRGCGSALSFSCPCAGSALAEGAAPRACPSPGCQLSPLPSAEVQNRAQTRVLLPSENRGSCPRAATFPPSMGSSVLMLQELCQGKQGCLWGHKAWILLIMHSSVWHSPGGWP